MTSENLAEFCRLCAEIYPKNTLIKMNSEEFINLSLAEKIYQYFVVNISENDTLPKDICSHCFKKVLDTYEFHQCIRRAQNTLQKKVEIKNEQIIKQDDIKSEDDSTSYDFMLDTNPIIGKNYKLFDNKTISIFSQNHGQNNLKIMIKL